MKVADLRHRIVIQKATKTADGTGGNTKVWTFFARRWAKVKPLNGSEFYHGQKLKNTITYKITIRYTTDVTPDMRVSFDGRLFDIHTITNKDERNCFKTLMCEEVDR